MTRYSEQFELQHCKNIMSETGREQLSHSQPPHNQTMANSKSLSLSSKAGHILQIQSELRKLKQIVRMQNQLRKNKEQFQKLNSQILQFEQRVKIQRKEAFKQKISQIQKRKHERQYKNKETNDALAKIKEEHRIRRKNMQSLINLYKDQYEHVYKHKINQKKLQMKLDMQTIKQHQSEYLKSIRKKRSYRIKTELNHHQYQNQSKFRIDRRSHRYSPSASTHDADLQHKKQLVRRRKEYGQNAERQAVNIKVSLDMIRKAKTQSKRGYDPDIDVYQNLKKKLQKPKLNTNFNGSVEKQQNKQIKKLAKGEQPVRQKLTKLKNLAQGYMVKYDNGHDSALQKISNVNLLRAQILLQDN